MTKVFQYEYALYLVVSRLFHSVRCASMCIESLKLYFRELPGEVKEEGDPASQDEMKKSQKKLIEEIEGLVKRDVIGHITFPMINVCAAEVLTSLMEDGTHRFIFTDGVYAFSLHLDIPRKGHPRRIEVRDIPAIRLPAD